MFFLAKGVGSVVMDSLATQVRMLLYSTNYIFMPMWPENKFICNNIQLILGKNEWSLNWAKDKNE